jgi:hypothetical protein
MKSKFLIYMRVLALLGLVFANIYLADNYNCATNFSLATILTAMADDEGELIYKKDFCECHVGGIKRPDFSSFCGMTWTCVSGTILSTCSSHPGCSSGCSCP